MDNEAEQRVAAEMIQGDVGSTRRFVVIDVDDRFIRLATAEAHRTSRRGLNGNEVNIEKDKVTVPELALFGLSSNKRYCITYDIFIRKMQAKGRITLTNVERTKADRARPEEAEVQQGPLSSAVGLPETQVAETRGLNLRVYSSVVETDWLTL